MISTPMLLLLNTEDALDHEQIRKSVREIANSGFDAVCFEFRRCRYSEFDETGRAAMRVAYEEAKRLGLGFTKTFPIKHDTLITKYPELKRRHWVEAPACLTAQPQQIPWDTGTRLLPDQLLRAFRVGKDAQDVITWVEDATADVAWSVREDALWASAGVPGMYLLFFSFEKVDLEKKVTDCADVDYSNDHVLELFDEILECYADYRLDGYAMDEFGAGSRKQGEYLANDCFFEKFLERYGYDLRDKLYLMHHKTTDTEFAKVRYDYYNFTVELTYRFQMKAKEKFTAKYGKDIFIGYHHTFWGEGNSGDLWAGNIDYFRLAPVLSGGFVDAQYDTERTMLSMNALAEGLAKYSGTGRAYNMCWDRITTPEKMDYYHRMLAVRNVNWVAHALAKGLHGKPRSTGKNTAIFFAGSYLKQLEGNPIWGDVNRIIHREHAMDRFIGGAKSDAKVAVLYIWESNAYYNNDYMHYHKLSFKALLDKLMTNNIPVDVVPSFERDFSDYDVIFALWPAMMPKALWEALKGEIEKGKQVYFMGPPACVTTEGENIAAEFETLTGCKVTDRHTYFGGHEYPAWDMWFTDRVIPMVTYCNDYYPIEAKNGNVRYYGYEAPLTETMFRIIEELAPYKTVKDTRLLSKTFEKEDHRILTLTGRWNARINDCITFEGNAITIENGLLLGIKCQNGKVVQILSEKDAKFTVNGEEYAYELI